MIRVAIFILVWGIAAVVVGLIVGKAADRHNEDPHR